MAVPRRHRHRRSTRALWCLECKCLRVPLLVPGCQVGLLRELRVLQCIGLLRTQQGRGRGERRRRWLLRLLLLQRLAHS